MSFSISLLSINPKKPANAPKIISIGAIGIRKSFEKNGDEKIITEIVTNMDNSFMTRGLYA